MTGALDKVAVTEAERLRNRAKGRAPSKMRFQTPNEWARNDFPRDDAVGEPATAARFMDGDDVEIPAPMRPVQQNNPVPADEDEIMAPVRPGSADLIEENDVKRILGVEDPVIQKLTKDVDDIKLSILRMEEGILRKRRADHYEGDDEGDDESDDGRLKGRKRNEGKKVKKASINQLQADIRKHTMHLMDRDAESDPTPPPPSRQTVQKYLDGDSNAGPSRTNFVIDLDAGSASPWNKAVTKLFVDDFLKVEWYKCKDRKAIAKGFKTHMDTLTKYYRRERKEGTSNIAACQRLSKAAQSRRKLQLYYRRLHVVKVHPHLHRHIQILEDLGVDGMSSDESNTEDHNRVYIVLKKIWRAAGVTLWLRDLDSVHLSLRVTNTGRVMRGNWPHERRDSSRVSDRDPVFGLPKNLYAVEWFSELSAAQVERVDATPTNYDLSHTDTIAAIASTWHGVRGPVAMPR